jgi:hypothetical protein
MRTFPSINTWFLAATIGLGCGSGEDGPSEPESPMAVVPPARAHHGLIYDDARQRVLLIGGSTPAGGGFVFFNDVWEFDGSAWKLVLATGPGRGGRGLAFDTQRNAIFSFGGYAINQALPELMRLNASSWETLGSLAERPTVDGGFVYDAQRNRFVIYGGSPGDGQVYSDTWEVNGTTWNRLNVSGPNPRQAFAMVYDSKRARTVLFGGMGPAQGGNIGTMFGDTWEFDGSTWRQVATTGPSPRIAMGYAYDSNRGLLLAFGGLAPTGFLGDTWSYDGSQWRKVSDFGPAARMMGFMAYDKRRDRVVLFGGRNGPGADLNDTWEWDGAAWRRVETAAR